jgi:putative endonuclease
VRPSPNRRSHNIDLGRRGEELVCEWYLGAGYEIVDRNWRCDRGEIDIVASIDSTLVFCEVKTRSSHRFGSPFEAITQTKLTRLRKLASLYMSLRGGPFVENIRIDVASVVGRRVDVLEGVD